MFYYRETLIKEDKLELSWAKLSLAGAMVFGLGMVELGLSFRMVLRSTH